MPFQPSHPNPAQAPDQRTEDAQYYRANLHELIDLGMVLARAVQANAVAQAAQDAPPATAAPGSAAASTARPGIDRTTPFDRIARCIRRTVLLAQRIAEAPNPAPAAAIARAAARRRILREVEDAIHRRARSPRGDRIDAEALQAELHERLDSPDLDDDIASRPIADIITEIVRDLGIDIKPLGVPPSRRRTPGDIAAMHARAAAVTPNVGRVWTALSMQGVT